MTSYNNKEGKISPDTAKQVKALHQLGMKYKDIEKRTGVNKNMIYEIIHNNLKYLR